MYTVSFKVTGKGTNTKWEISQARSLLFEKTRKIDKTNIWRDRSDEKRRQWIPRVKKGTELQIDPI